jgi:hypothetical protein
MADKSDLRKLIKLIKQVRPECAKNLEFEVWLVDRIYSDFPNINFDNLKNFIETKLAFFEGDITVPIVMNWCRYANTQWTNDKKQIRDNYFNPS